MCGIAGGVGVDAPSEQLMKRQLSALKHRGPDDEGYFCGSNVILGMCRLAIVEINSGKQPASNSDNNVHIVWNGEIYNYRELRYFLESRNVRSRNESESEVILNLYLTFGHEFVKHLNGMFAIAIYDGRNNSLNLFRDRLGKKPLWISSTKNGSLLFSSEVRALKMALPQLTLRREMIPEVMQYGYINSPKSTYVEIDQVKPGTYLRWENGKIRITDYWFPEFRETKNITYDEALAETKNRISLAVAQRLVSERPIGAFLSGGIDSTVVTALMCQLLNGKVKTFTIGFENEAFNEANHARDVARYLGTEHNEKIIIADPIIIVEKISKILDQPLADSSIIPTYLLSNFARENVIVALGGDGGDEVFGGYDRYLATPALNILNPVLGISRLGLWTLDKRILGKGRKINRASEQLKNIPTLAKRYSSIHSLTSVSEMRELMNEDIISIDAELRFISEFEDGYLSKLNRMIRSDLNAYLPGDLLLKADIASMANSLELRSPFLDVNVVEWGIALPKKFRIRGLTTKRILKDIAYSLVPKELIDRPKMGFGVPMSDWLRRDLRELALDTLTDNTAKQRGWFKQDKVKNLLNLHFSGQDKHKIIWPMICLELWARNWLD